MTSSPGVTALNEAGDAIGHVLRYNRVDDDTRGLLLSVVTRIDQARAVLVQTETHLEVCTESSLAAHKRVDALEACLEQLHIRESIAYMSHGERVKLIENCRPGAPRSLRSFVVSTDTPRPTAAPL